MYSGASKPQLWQPQFKLGTKPSKISTCVLYHFLYGWNKKGQLENALEIILIFQRNKQLVRQSTTAILLFKISYSLGFWLIVPSIWPAKFHYFRGFIHFWVINFNSMYDLHYMIRFPIWKSKKIYNLYQMIEGFLINTKGIYACLSIRFLSASTIKKISSRARYMPGKIIGKISSFDRVSYTWEKPNHKAISLSVNILVNKKTSR